MYIVSMEATHMKIQFAKHTDRKARWMTAERTLFVTILGVAILITNYEARESSI